MINNQEYLAAFHNKLLARQTASMVFSGDSTTEGGETHATGDFLIHTAVLNQGLNRGHKLTAINSGHSTKHTGQWVTDYFLDDLALGPTLYVLRWGTNDPFYGRSVEDFTMSLRDGLAQCRNLKPLSQMSILLMAPNSTNDPASGRDAAWHEAISPVIIQAANDYMCAYIDTFHMWPDSINAAGKWMDAPYGDSRALHPLNVMNSWIASEIVDLIFPSALDVPSHGTYIPSIVSITNANAVTASRCQWSRVGNFVSVTGRADVNIASANTPVKIGISLPLISDLTESSNLAGSGAIGQAAVAIYADVVNNRAEFQFTSTTTIGTALFFTLSYYIQ